MEKYIDDARKAIKKGCRRRNGIVRILIFGKFNGLPCYEKGYLTTIMHNDLGVAKSVIWR